jgi:hypothetical protein
MLEHSIPAKLRMRALGSDTSQRLGCWTTSASRDAETRRASRSASSEPAKPLATRGAQIARDLSWSTSGLTNPAGLWSYNTSYETLAPVKETYGAYPSAEIDVVDEDTHARIRVREPNLGKASIFLTAGELEEHARECLRLAEQLRQRGAR